MGGVKFDMAALDAMAQAQKQVPQVLTRTMTAAAQRIVVPAFQQEARSQPAPAQVKRFTLPGSYATAGFSGYTLVGGVSGEQLSGGGIASDLARPWEFGTVNHAPRPVRRKNLKLGSVYYRDTTAQIPPRRRGGWVFYPAAGDLSKRAVPLYVQVAVKVLADALEGK